LNAQQSSPENKLGTMPINSLLFHMAVPIIISMLVQALYNVVDSIFVGRLSEEALNAVSLAFPLQNLMISVAVGTGVGINALLSKSLGEKKFDQASRTAENGLFLAAISGAVFLVFGFLGSELFFKVQTDIASIVTQGKIYLSICSVCSFGMFFQVAMERILQATGRTVYTMITQLTGAVINLILDPILIFGLFGFPRMEIAGAAIATVLGQIVAACLNFYFNHRFNTDVHIRLRGFRPSRRIIGAIYSVGVPSIAMSSIGSVMVFGMNKILLAFTPTATAVFGVYFKLQSFIFMPVFGLNNGMVPIVAYNYGARKPDRIVKTVKLSICCGVGIMVIGFIIFQLFTAPLLRMFEAEDATGAMIEIGVPALRIISVSFLFAGYCIVSSAMFQALGHGVLSLTMSCVRQLMVLLPVALLLSRIGGLHVVWWAFPFAELFSVTLASIFLRRIYQTEIRPLYQEIPSAL